MKSPKIFLFLTIVSLIVASGWLPVMNASAAPVNDGWKIDPTVPHGTNSQSVSAESINISKLPKARTLSSTEQSRLLKLVPPLGLPVDAATFAKIKTNAAKTPAPAAGNIQKFTANQTPSTLSGITTATTAPSIIDNFAGPSMNGYYPADASIAVGPTGVIACVNASVTGYDKTGLLLYNTPMTTLWSSAQRGGYSLIFNPVCKYDSLGGRFIIVAALENASPFASKYMVAVSQTSGNNSGWYTYSFDASIDGSTASSFFAAFPDVGVDNNAVYITSNQYSVSTQTFQYAKIRVFQKSQLYTNTVTGWTDFWNFTNVYSGTKSFAVRAALSQDATDYEYLTDSQPTGGSQLTMFRITSSNPWTTPVFAIAKTQTATTAYSVPPNAVDYDINTYALIPTSDSRLLNLVYRNGSLWTAHTIAGSTTNTTVAAIRWYQIDPAAATEIQEGTFVDSRDYYSYYYPAITVDAQGDMGITFTWSGPGYVDSGITLGYPSAGFTGRLSTDTAGLVENPQYKFAPGARVNTSGRWGAYNGAAVDPSSSRMWFIGQLPGASVNSWSTQIFSTEFAIAQPFNKTSPVDGATNQSVATMLTWSASTGADYYQYCYDTTNDNACNWATATATSSVSATLNLLPSTTYYWQVRAVRGAIYTYADGSSTAFRRFTTGALPLSFGKISPVTGTTNSVVAPTFNWNPSSGATSYSFCLTTIATACDPGVSSPYWTNVGNVTSYPVSSNLLSSTTYYWQIRANNVIGKTYGDANTAWKFTTTGPGTPPGPFGKSSPSNNAPSTAVSLSLNWGTSSGASWYEYCYTTSTNCSSGSWTNVGALTSASISGLTEASGYHWQVRAVNANGYTYADGGSASTQNWLFTTGALPVAFSKTAPANNATGVGFYPTLTWAPSSGATSYAYCLSQLTSDCLSTGPGWINVDDSTSVAISSPLAENTTYYWHVRATNLIGSRYTNSDSEYQFKTGSLPGTFVKVLPGVDATNQVLSTVLTWTASTSAINSGTVGYEYCYSTSFSSCTSTGFGTWSTVNPTATTVTLSGLNPDTDYYWQIRAKNYVGYTYADGDPATRHFHTGLSPNDFSKTPANAATSQSSSVNLSWTTSNGTGYEYCFSTSTCTPASTWTATIPTGTTIVTVNGLGTPGSIVTYYWQVRTSNSIGYTYADTGTVFTYLVGAVPGAFTMTTPANGATNQITGPTLNWGASSGASAYYYCTSTTSGTCDSSSSTGTWTNVSTNTSAILSGLTSGTTYYWNVKANNAIGDTFANPTAWSFTISQIPVGFNKASPTSGSTGVATLPTLTWNSSSNAVSYDYCVSTSSSSCTGSGTGIGTWINKVGTSVTLTNALTINTTYYWQVRAVNPAGTTEANGGSYWSFTTVNGPPAAFTKALPASSTSTNLTQPIALSWNASAGVDHYEYCYTTSTNCGSGPWINIGTNTSLTVSGLTPNTTYRWQIRAVNGVGTTYADAGSATTNNWAFHTASVTGIPGTFTKSAPADGSTNLATTPNLTLSWGTASGTGVTYEYCITTTYNDCTNTGAGTWVSTGTTRTATLTGLSLGTTYYWQVRASNSTGTAYADSVDYDFSFTTASMPGSFGKTSPSNAAINQVALPTLSWGTSAGSGITYFYCVATTNICNSGGGTWASAGTSTSVPLTTSLLSNTLYYWQVRATTNAGTVYADTVDTASWTFTTGTLPGAFAKSSPANVTTPVLTTSPTLNWGASTNASSYEYCRYTNTSNDCTSSTSPNWVSAGTNLTANLSALTEGTTYNWEVRAVNSIGATYADGGSVGSTTGYWQFATGRTPGAFSKSAPTTASTNQPTGITLSWATSSNAASFDYCISALNTDCSSAGSGIWTNTGATRTASPSGLTLSTLYYWNVRALSNMGHAFDTYSNTGTVWTFTTGGTAGAFGKTSPSNAAINQALLPTLSWGASANAASYDYCVSTASSSCTGSGTGIGTWINTNLTSATLTNSLTAGTTYYWQVRANSGTTTYADGGSATTGFWSFKTIFTKTSPTNGATNQGGFSNPRSVNITWAADSGATQYQYCSNTSATACVAGGAGTWTSTGTTLNATLSLSSATTYYWQVRSTADGGATYNYADAATVYNFRTR